MTNPVLENLKTRRAIRKYLPRQVEPEKLDLILEGGYLCAYRNGDAVSGYHRCAGIPNRFKSWQSSTPR